MRVGHILLLMLCLWGLIFAPFVPGPWLLCFSFAGIAWWAWKAWKGGHFGADNPW